MNALILSAFFGVVMMFSSFLLNSKSAVRGIAIAGLVVILLSNILETYGTVFFKINTGGMMVFDRFGLFFITIATAATLIYFLLSARDMEKVGVNYSEYFALIFFILAGIVLTSTFRNLLILFLGIEIISIPLYILTGSEKRNLKSNEASLKYFLLGSFSTGLMLMGIALVYGGVGTFETGFLLIHKPVPILIIGMAFLLFSMSFKVSAAPFHFWTPDVYDGAPTVFTSFMATIVKAAVFIAFIRLFEERFGVIRQQWQVWIAVITAATLFIGNITAVFQQSVKRMLAYSSIAQAGFMLLALFALNTEAKEGILLYAAAYSLATIGIFAVLAKMTDYTFEGFNGFAKSNPLLAGVLTVCLLSLAGIPLTAGFMAKFFMLRATVLTPHGLWLAIFAVLMAAVSAYYYFRVIQAMYFKEGDAKTVETSGGFRATLLVLAVVILLIGVFPNLLLNWFYF